MACVKPALSLLKDIQLHSFCIYVYPPCGSPGLKSAWQQGPLSTESSHCPPGVGLLMKEGETKEWKGLRQRGPPCDG